MPRKVRELKAQIKREGFVYLPKKGKVVMSAGDTHYWPKPLQSLVRMVMMLPGIWRSKSLSS